MINKFISLLNKLLFKLHICVILDKKKGVDIHRHKSK